MRVEAHAIHLHDERRTVARETLEIYAPIANRLGIHTVKSELEELGFKAVTDGEYNRGGWQRDFLLSFENVALIPSRVPVRFHTADGVVLLAVKWETHATPRSGIRH